MTQQQAALAERVRVALADGESTREVPMFGVRAFLVHDKLVVGARKDGGLLVRVAADRHEELLARPGAEQAEMGAGRTMGSGWIAVSTEPLTDDEGLGFWLDVAREHNRAATGRT